MHFYCGRHFLGGHIGFSTVHGVYWPLSPKCSVHNSSDATVKCYIDTLWLRDGSLLPTCLLDNKLLTCVQVA